MMMKTTSGRKSKQYWTGVSTYAILLTVYVQPYQQRPKQQQQKLTGDHGIEYNKVHQLQHQDVARECLLIKILQRIVLKREEQKTDNPKVEDLSLHEVEQGLHCRDEKKGPDIKQNKMYSQSSLTLRRMMCPMFNCFVAAFNCQTQEKHRNEEYHDADPCIRCVVKGTDEHGLCNYLT
jgi:hypothetical protein